MDDFETPSLRAASLKLPSSTTCAKTSMAEAFERARSFPMRNKVIWNHLLSQPEARPKLPSTRPGSSPMTHRIHVFALGLLALALAPAAQAAESIAAVRPASVVAVGHPDAATRTNVNGDRSVLFQNIAAASTRVVFGKRDARKVDCQTSDTGARRSRPGQYVLEPGAEMACRLDAGTIRYSTFTLRDGAIAEEKGRLRVD